MDASPLFQVVAREKYACTGSKHSRFRHLWHTYPVVSLVILAGILSCVLRPLVANHDPANSISTSEYTAESRVLLWHRLVRTGYLFHYLVWRRVSLTVGFLAMIISTCQLALPTLPSGLASPACRFHPHAYGRADRSIPSHFAHALMLAFVHEPDVLIISWLSASRSWMNLARIVRSEVRKSAAAIMSS